ncbi:1-phosphofructokinase [Lentibacillus sediminis]|uniref:1-phosphofructokinase n=1 Tax=Lentibacillus sediminis TaxID=1940529 RepID=UPI000C1C0585|nr:1-phosphofructokinase [Lentibacillus sediminis]
MIYTITLNPSIDYVVQVNRLELGKLNKMENELKLPGGKGINVSRLLQELDYETTALGFLGGFTGNFIATRLQADGIPADFIPVEADSRINLKLKSEQETEINGRGPEISSKESEQLLRQLETITAQDIVILSGSKPPSLPTDFYQRLVDTITSEGAEFVIDTTGAALKAALPEQPLLVKPNLEELAELYDVNMHQKEDALPYGKKLLEAGAKNVIVSMAGEGALLFTQDGIFHGMPPKGKVKNSVGAGDSMIAGFIGKYTKTQDVQQAFQMGIASGSATAFSDDLAKKDNILALLNQIEITRLA